MNNGMLAWLAPELYDKESDTPFSSPVSVIPESSSGNITITKRVMPAGTRMEMLGGGGLLRYKEDITLTLLKEDERLWMSDSPSEMADMEVMASYAQGHVFVAGLGLGLLAHKLAENEKVDKITIVEINKNIIDLVKDYLPEKVEIVHSDFTVYITTHEQSQFDYFILDIYPDISSDDFEVMLNHWALITKEGKRGCIWGLGLVVEQMLQSWRGHTYPSEFADEAEEAGFSDIADFIHDWWDDDDYYEGDVEFYGEEEEAMSQYFNEIGIDYV